jgi:Zn-finger nucleic acid-binding protein
MARCRCGTSFALPKPPEWAGGLACPNCAAMCPPDKDQCGFCGTVLQVVACPRCFGKAFAGSKHCTHCGTAIDEGARAIVEAEAHRGCPRCAVSSRAELVPLVAHLVGDTLLDTCPRCDGVWVDLTALEKIIADRDRQTALVALGVPAARGTLHVEPEVHYLRCPECAGMMTRTNFGKRSGVIIDVCRAHGTWFDRDELRAVVEYVMNGGLLESHRRDVEEIRREVREKEQRIRALGASQGTAVGTEVHDGWRKASLFVDALAVIVRLLS